MITNRIEALIRMGIPKIVKIHDQSLPLIFVFFDERDAIQFASLSFCACYSDCRKTKILASQSGVHKSQCN